VTSSDSTNFVASRIAIDIYHVPIVVARAYNPHRLPVYERFGIQTVASSSWGAHRMEEMITSPHHASRLSIGNGDVEVVETRVPEQWAGRRIADLDLAEAKAVALTRGGKARLAGAELVLEAGDLLYLAVGAGDMSRITALFPPGRS
jgi:trk system potassium uptake protein TrkA